MKDKKLAQKNLAVQGVLYTLLSLFTIFAVPMLLFWTLVNLNLFFYGTEMGGVRPFEWIFLGIAALCCVVMGMLARSAWQNTHQFWAQSKRNRALKDESKRVARLMETNDLEDFTYEESSEVQRNET